METQLCNTKLALYPFPCENFADVSFAINEPVLILGGDSTLALQFIHFLRENNIDFYYTSRRASQGKDCFELDASQANSIDSFVHTIIRRKLTFGSVVNFIAQIDQEYPENISEFHDTFSKLVGINLVFPFIIFKSLIPFLKNRSKIVQIGGGGASTAMPGFPGYSATKAGLVRLIETLSLDFADFEIFINVLGPGPFTSPIFEQAHQESNIHASFSKNRNKNTQEPPLINTHNTCKVIARMISAEFDGISGNFLSAQWDDWSESPMKLIQHRECNHHLKLRRVKC